MGRSDVFTCASFSDITLLCDIFHQSAKPNYVFTLSQTSKSTLSVAWVMDVTHGFMGWRRWAIRLPRVKRCLFRMLQPSGTWLSSLLWSLHPWRQTLHWLRLSFRAHSKIQDFVCWWVKQWSSVSNIIFFLPTVRVLRFLLIVLFLGKPYSTCHHCPWRPHPQSSPSSSLWTSWRRWMDFSSG